MYDNREYLDYQELASAREAAVPTAPPPAARLFRFPPPPQRTYSADEIIIDCTPPESSLYWQFRRRLVNWALNGYPPERLAYDLRFIH